MRVSIATAPSCWGVERGHDTHRPGWELVLDEVAAAGYSALELGPAGYIPLAPRRVGAALHMRRLHIVAGTVCGDLARPAHRAGLLEQTAEICALLSGLPAIPRIEGQQFAAPYLAVADSGAGDSDGGAGHSGRARPPGELEWADLVGNIRAIAQLARDEYGVRAVICPHAGGLIAFAEQIERIAAEIPADMAGLCIDTGHAFYAGMDPAETLRRHAGRLDYIHFKDIDRQVFDRAMGQRIPFSEASALGVMCPVGEGCIDFAAIRAALADLDYAGFATVGREGGPRNSDGALRDAKRSRDFLKAAGF